MAPKICIPLTPTSPEILATQLEEARFVGDLVEVYVDYLPEVSENIFDTIAKSFPDGVITLRRPQFKTCHNNLKVQKQILALSSHYDLIFDLDIFNEIELWAEARKIGIKAINSYHNYLCTPTRPELESIFTELSSGYPAYIKIACRANDQLDSLRLLELLIQKRSITDRLIVSVMGTDSLPGRILCGLWGSTWVYAPLDDHNATAEGQVSAKHIRTLFENYQKRG